MIENTGERIIPEFLKPTNGMLLEHIARYHFSLPYLKGRVLDIACGSGYGSQILAKALKFSDSVNGEVIGVDKDESIIQYAKGAYYHPKLKFINKNATAPDLPETLGTFDLIVCFETLEHIAEEQPFLENLYQMLNPQGTLILSTPFGQGRGKNTNERFHVHQLTQEEFFNLFKNYSQTEFFYQKGLIFEPFPGRNKIHYPMGIAVCRK